MAGTRGSTWARAESALTARPVAGHILPISLPWRRNQRNWSPQPSGWVGLALATPFLLMLVVYVIYPFVRLVQTALGDPSGWGNVQTFFANAANVLVVQITFRDAAIVTAIDVIAGGLMAWALKSTRSKFMRLALLSAIFVPFWMGAVVKIYAFTALLGRAGIINTLLMNVHLINAPLHLLYTQPAVVAGMVYQMLPLAVLPMYVAFSSIDTDLIVAAEGLGASRARAIIDVVLPLAVPGIFATLVINFVLALGFYLTPVLLGGLTTPFTATLIQQDLFAYSDFPDASIGGLMLFLGAIAAVTLGYFLVGKERLRRAISA
jgi:ABC-type spermidine/putrescine transport system permease subunit I